MGGGPVLAWLAAVAVAVAASGASDHWSRPATPERRSGDWVPLNCAVPNCRPLDQGTQASDSLPSVLTPPPRVEEARLLPPPPPDGLFQTAASGFLQAFTQQQPPRKPLQFLQETTQSDNRPQAQFLKSQAPAREPQFLREPSAEFTPPRDPQLAPFDQRFLPEQPYLNQPLFIGPQFLAAPFFPQTSLPPQNIQPVGPVRVQPQAPISPNVPEQSFQISADRPVFLQQITAGVAQIPPSAPQQLPQALLPEQQYSVSGNSSQANEEEKDEVQLLYVPVETLNRARNMGRPKSIAEGAQQQQVVAATETNTFTSPSENYEFSTLRSNVEEQTGLNIQSQISKHQYNTKPNSQFQQQLPPEDQEKFNTQTYTVAQQFNIQPQNEQFNQAPLEIGQSFKTKPTKQQYNFKLNNQYQQLFPQEQANFAQASQFQRLPDIDNQKGIDALDQSMHQQILREQNLPQQTQPQLNAQLVNQQFTNQQNGGRFQQVAPVQQQRYQQPNVPVEQEQKQQRFQEQTIPVEQQRFQPAFPVEQQHFQQQTIPVEQQRFQQQTVGIEQERFRQEGAPARQLKLQKQAVPVEQQRSQQAALLGQQHFQVQNTRTPQSQLGQSELPNHETLVTQQQPQINQQATNTGTTLKDQPYINQPIEFNQQILNQDQVHTENPTSQQTYHQQQFNQAEIKQQTDAPVSQTRTENYTPQQGKKQRFRNSQDSMSNVQQQNNQFTRKFPQDYGQTTSVDTSAKLLDPLEQAYNIRQQQENTWTQNQNVFSQQDVSDIKHSNKFQSTHEQGLSLARSPSTQSPPQTTLAPNQPPLSVYMETTEDNKVNDVLRLLKNAKTIQVLDTVGPESPQVFVGPSNLKAPTGYIKFELPYLNAIENNNRVERKVDKLPFFVAPLNFNPPPGYSKIPFPAPHIGSVVVSNVTILKTALHEKPYEDHQIQVSTTERFKDQYTLPAEIPPISPQLPSLINSLQDEIYSGSSTNFPTTTPEVSTPAHTTPSYRSRGSSRGSYRGTATSNSPSRRPQSRTRRPYDGQPYSRRRTTTTTPEPSTEALLQQFTAQPEQLALNTNSYNVQNTASPVRGQAEGLGNQQTFGQENAPEYQNEPYLANNYNQFPSQPQQTNVVDHTTHVSAAENIGGLKQYHKDEDSTQNFVRDTVIQTTGVPALARPIQQEDQTFTSQRTGGTRRDPTRQHQRFRGRQRLTTTTTEQYEKPIEQEPQFDPQQTHHLNQQIDARPNYQNAPSGGNLDNHRLVENTHFTASIPSNKFNIQTERSDAVFQTTERQFISQNEEQITNKNINKDNRHEFPQPQFNPNSQSSDANGQRQVQLQYNPGQIQENLNFNLGQTEANDKKVHSQFEQVSQVQQTSLPSTNQFQQQDNVQKESFQQNTDPQLQSYFHQVNADHIDQVGNIQAQQNYFNQQNQQTPEIQSIVHQKQGDPQQDYNAKQLFEYSQQERESISNQEQQITKSDQTAVSPQIPIETPTQPDPVLQEENESKRTQYNQQRLDKYNRQQSRGQFNPSSINEHQINHQEESVEQNLQDYSKTPEVSSTEAATTRTSLVRVRGRVRGRQRASSRNHQSTTTEEPNYPTTYLNRQRSNQERDDSQQDYTARKRTNYNRQSARNTYKENQNTPDSSYANTEKQPTSDSFVTSSDISSTTTEAPTTIKGRRYQHILNRNKISRTRPTNSPSTAGSPGSTRFLTPTSPPPVTRLPVTRGRIRKPVSTSTTTTEYPEVSKKWTEQDNFAPSAGSNEILEPLYQTKDKIEEQPSYGFLRPPVIPPKTVPKEVPPPENQDNYWNQGVTIQQSTSFDFKADPAAVTPPSFASNDQNDGVSSIWNGQIELQDGQFYDVFNQHHQASKHANDQTPFSSDQQKVVYKDVKNRQHIGKENQYTEKTYEITKPSTELEEDGTEQEKVYPVYREIIKPAESIQDEAQSQVPEDPYKAGGKGYEKEVIEHSEQLSKDFPQDEIASEGEREVKEGPLKRKISATNAGKKGLRRRGQWVRVRVRKPQDSLETAESQNLAVHSENTIQTVTKQVGEKTSRTPEPSSTTSTEIPQTTTEIPAVSEPAETINFEEALKDMLKEFITNPDENKDEEGTEANTMIPGDVTNVSTKEEEGSENKPYQLSEEPEKQRTQDEVAKEQDGENPNNKKQESVAKTPIAEASTETLTQEPTTVFQTNENFETTIEPEVTTNPNNQINNSHHSRVLGTSTTTEISLETEICYRGRCVKTKKLDSDSDLLTME